MTDPYIDISTTKLEFFDNELGAVRTLKQLSDGTYVTNIASGGDINTGTDNTKIVTPKAINDAGLGIRLQSKIILGTRDMAAVSGYDNYTGAGFRPTSVQVFAIINGTIYTSQGFGDSTKFGSCLAVIDATQSSYVDSFIYINTATGAHQAAQIRSFDADGISLDWLQTGSPTGTIVLRFLCFR